MREFRKNKDKVLEFLDLLKGVEIKEEDMEEGIIDINDSAREITKEIFTKGDCGRLYYILKYVFPTAVPYLVTKDKDGMTVHIITKINGKFYDINGLYDTKDPDILFSETDEDTISDDYMIDRCYSFNQRGSII